MSIALHLFTAVYTLYTTPASARTLVAAPGNSTLVDIAEELLVPETALSKTWFVTASCLLGFYVFSIVFGRLYTGMHSFTDCAVGILLGTTIWTCHFLFGGIIDTWIKHSGWIGRYSRLASFNES